MASLLRFIEAVAAGDTDRARRLVTPDPEFVHAGLARVDERLIAGINVQVYAGDTALHAAAFTYDVTLAKLVVKHGADIHARNRRGATPLHAATIGGPGSLTWKPPRQRQMIEFLVGAGAEVDARASGEVTPLHRAVRNRCSSAVAALLAAGADSQARNGRGSTPLDLARHTSGRSGAGSAAARTEQQKIIELLAGS